MSTDTKPSNPKEVFGDAKMDMALLPDTAAVQFNLAFLEGALKYGQYNWRVAGVRVSTYVKAARRHLSKFWNGQNADPVTMVHELASAGACCAIILDAMAVGKLTDDRPPRADMERALADAAKVAAHLKQLFKDHSPIQYTQQWVDDQAVKELVERPGTTLRDVVDLTMKQGHGRRVSVKLVPAGTHKDCPSTPWPKGTCVVLDGGPGRPRVAGVKPRKKRKTSRR